MTLTGMNITIIGPQFVAVDIQGWETRSALRALADLARYDGLEAPTDITVRFETSEILSSFATDKDSGSNYLGLYPFLHVKDGYPTGKTILIGYDEDGKTSREKIIRTLTHEWWHLIHALNRKPDFQDEELASKWEALYAPMVEVALKSERRKMAERGQLQDASPINFSDITAEEKRRKQERDIYECAETVVLLNSTVTNSFLVEQLLSHCESLANKIKQFIKLRDAIPDYEGISPEEYIEHYVSWIGDEEFRKKRYNELADILGPSDSFPWPGTEALDGGGLLEGTIFQHEQGVLGWSGYHVGANSEPSRARREILDKVYLNTLPTINSKEYMQEWDNPRTGPRLQKIANSIAANTRNAKRRNAERMHIAINDWEEDLAYLKKIYYDGRYDFGWPTTM
ncbi:MAG: hypothetical protein WA666_00150 [Nitrospirota bacterium]